VGADERRRGAVTQLRRLRRPAACRSRVEEPRAPGAAPPRRRVPAPAPLQLQRQVRARVARAGSLLRELAGAAVGSTRLPPRRVAPDTPGPWVRWSA
jgi:hypothetical protein